MTIWLELTVSGEPGKRLFNMQNVKMVGHTIYGKTAIYFVDGSPPQWVDESYEEIHSRLKAVMK